MTTTTTKPKTIDTGREIAYFKQSVCVEFISDDANIVMEAIRKLRVALQTELNGKQNVYVFLNNESQVSTDIVRHNVDPALNRPEEK